MKYICENIYVNTWTLNRVITKIETNYNSNLCLSNNLISHHNRFQFEMKIAFIIAHTRNNVVVLFGTLKVQSFMLTEVRDCDLLIVVTSSTFLK